jgi:hypothetical protein
MHLIEALTKLEHVFINQTFALVFLDSHLSYEVCKLLSHTVLLNQLLKGPKPLRQLQTHLVRWQLQYFENLFDVMLN